MVLRQGTRGGTGRKGEDESTTRHVTRTSGGIPSEGHTREDNATRMWLRKLENDGR